MSYTQSRYGQMLAELNDHQYLFAPHERRLINEATQLVENGDDLPDDTLDALLELHDRL